MMAIFYYLQQILSDTRITKRLTQQFLLLLLFPFSVAIAQPTTESKAYQELSQLIDDIQTYQANFLQKVIDGYGDIIHTSSGEFKLKKPGLFLWRVRDPSTQLVISDAKNLWQYDADLKQVQKKDVTPLSQDANPITILTNGLDAIKNHYEIVKMPSDTSKKYFKLVPLSVANEEEKVTTSAQAFIVEIILVFNRNRLVQITYNDRLQQSTDIKFDAITVNLPLVDGLFTFSPPPGVDIIEQ